MRDLSTYSNTEYVSDTNTCTQERRKVKETTNGHKINVIFICVCVCVCVRVSEVTASPLQRAAGNRVVTMQRKEQTGSRHLGKLVQTHSTRRVEK